MISKKALRKVDPADVEVLAEVSRRMLRRLTEKTRTQNLEAVDEMRKEGIEVLAIDGATRQEFFVTGRRAWKDGVGRLYSQDLLDRVNAALSEYRNNHSRSSSAMM